MTFYPARRGGTPPFVVLWQFPTENRQTEGVVATVYDFGATGVYSVNMVVTDSSVPPSACNVAKSVTVGAVVNPPQVSVVANQRYGETTVDFTSLVRSGTAPYAYLWAFGDSATSTEANPVHSYRGFGPQFYSITVTDSMNARGTASGVITLVPAPMVVSFTASSNYLAASFDASVAFGISPYTFIWDFGDEGTGSGQSATHAYSAAGVYQVALLVIDSDGSDKPDSKSITVSAQPLPLEVSFDYDIEQFSAVFGATVSGGAGTKTYLWSFGDGATSSEESPAHTYASIGTYTVSLTVTDSTGSDVYSTTITVTGITVPPLNLFLGGAMLALGPILVGVALILRKKRLLLVVAGVVVAVLGALLIFGLPGA